MNLFCVCLASGFLHFSFFVLSVWGATTFDDLKTSYAQFEKWQPRSSSQGIEGKLSFFFKTHLRDSILLYQDDGSRDYISVELIRGKVFLRFLVSGNRDVGVQIGHDLADMMWHKILIELNNDRVILTLDQNLTQTATIPSRNEALLGATGFMYVGGLPRSLSLSSLSSPQAAFKKRFVGCIKKVMRTNRENILERAILINSKGTKSGCLNGCRVRNPCLNNGRCVNRFSKAKCDCSGTGFEGKRCEKEILRLRLSSNDYLVYDMSSRPQATLQDHVNVHFKTAKKDGLLLQTNFAQDYVTVKLSNGRILVGWNLGSGKVNIFIGSNLHDDRWHMIDIRRFRRNIKVILDGVNTKESRCPPSHSTFNMNGGEGKVFVGGSEAVSKMDRFKGCLRRVLFGGVDFISKLKANDPRLTLVGTTVWSCGIPRTTLTTVPMTTVAMTARATRARTRKIHRPGGKRVVIRLDSNAPRAAVPNIKTEEIRSTKSVLKPTTCSPNDVRCVLMTRPKGGSRITEHPTENIRKPDPVYNTTPPGPFTGNASTDVGKPKQDTLQDVGTQELGNVPRAVGLVVGSIVLFLLCALIAYKFSKYREQKHRMAHQIKVEVRDEVDVEDEKIDPNGFHQDVPVTN